MKDTLRWVVATALWTASGSLMVVGIVRGSIATMLCGIYVALMACLVTDWIIADSAAHRERVRVDLVVAAVVDRLQGDSDLPHI